MLKGVNSLVTFWRDRMSHYRSYLARVSEFSEASRCEKIHVLTTVVGREGVHVTVDSLCWLAKLEYFGRYALPKDRLAQVTSHEPVLPDYNFGSVQSAESAKYKWSAPT